MKSVLKYRIEGEIEFDPSSPASFVGAQETVEAAANELGRHNPTVTVRIASARKEKADV